MEEKKKTTEEQVNEDLKRMKMLKEREQYHKNLKFEIETLELEEKRYRLERMVLEHRAFFDKLNEQMKKNAQEKEGQKKQVEMHIKKEDTEEPPLKSDTIDETAAIDKLADALKESE